MCGILFYLGSEDVSQTELEKSVEILKLRGPDNNKLEKIKDNMIMGFSRLSINDISDNGNQPIKKGGCYLICNGEIYNHMDLVSKNEFQMNSKSDCEVIIDMYLKYGISKAINDLDGVFAFVLYDSNTNKLFMARDPFGVRPLFLGYTKKNKEVLICSEIKPISSYCDRIEQFKPGYSGEFVIKSIIKSINTEKQGKELRILHIEPYFIYSHCNRITSHNENYFKENEFKENEFKENIRHLFSKAVNKRLMSDRPIGCLLSGGLDSSLVSALVAKNYAPYTLNTFSIGMKGSTDLYYANLAAEHIKSKHHNIELTNDDFLNAIEETIYMIESYDITTVRASVGNYLVGKYIKENTDCKVIYNGDGSEEIMGSYLWLSNIDNEEDFFTENVKLLEEIYFYDVLRSDRSISDNGLEARVPFLDKEFVRYIMSIPSKFKMFGGDKIEKKLLRDAFANMNLLPNEVLYRKKEAFSDGVSSVEKSWFQIIQEKLEKEISDEELVESQKKYMYNMPETKEALYYRRIFEKHFEGHSNIIPHFWMPNPKWCNVKDPSARILNTYKT